MWKVLLDMLLRARRPLVFVDFETSDLGGAPPVEFAVLKYEPWLEPEQDEVSKRARRLAPPGLTYAGSVRVDPGRPIAPGAAKIHGITEEALRGCPRWDDLEIRAIFRSIATGDASLAEGPAIWVGHNIAQADAPWAATWGYFPGYPDDDAMIDTRRLFERLADEHPRPLAVDLIAESEGMGWRHTSDDPLGVRPCPAIGWGLDKFRANLGSAHVALAGAELEEAHGALADCLGTARILAAMLELWSPLWPVRVATANPGEALAELVRFLGRPKPGFPAWDGWLKPDGAGGLTWARGKHVGRPACPDTWVRDLPRHPTGVDGRGWCAEATARLISDVPGQRRLPGA
jgi:DNA polymerase III epsilon subunit-like protein